MFNPLAAYGNVDSASKWFDPERQEKRKLSGEIQKEKYSIN